MSLNLAHNFLDSSDQRLERVLRWLIWVMVPKNFPVRGHLREVPLVPNLLSLSRVPLAFSIWYLLDITGPLWLILTLFALALLSDRLDGTWARLYDMESSFGQIFDPVCDKLFLFVLLGALSGLIWPVALWPLVALELVLLALPLADYLAKRAGRPSPIRQVRANRWGKTKFVLECLALAILLVFGPAGELSGNLCLALAATFAGLSLWGKVTCSRSQ